MRLPYSCSKSLTIASLAPSYHLEMMMTSALARNGQPLMCCFRPPTPGEGSPIPTPPFSISSLMSMWTPRCCHYIGCTYKPLLFLALLLGLFTLLYMASTELILLSQSNIVFHPQVSALPFSPIGAVASRAHDAHVQVSKE